MFIAHRASARAQLNAGLPRRALTALCDLHSHCDSSPLLPACGGSALHIITGDRVITACELTALAMARADQGAPHKLSEVGGALPTREDAAQYPDLPPVSHRSRVSETRQVWYGASHALGWLARTNSQASCDCCRVGCSGNCAARACNKVHVERPSSSRVRAPTWQQDVSKQQRERLRASDAPLPVCWTSRAVRIGDPLPLQPRPALATQHVAPDAE